MPLQSEGELIFKIFSGFEGEEPPQDMTEVVVTEEINSFGSILNMPKTITRSGTLGGELVTIRKTFDNSAVPGGERIEGSWEVV